MEALVSTLREALLRILSVLWSSITVFSRGAATNCIKRLPEVDVEDLHAQMWVSSTRRRLLLVGFANFCGSCNIRMPHTFQTGFILTVRSRSKRVVIKRKWVTRLSFHPAQATTIHVGLNQSVSYNGSVLYCPGGFHLRRGYV